MTIYKFRLTYDKFPNFAREYEVSEGNTLYDLHRFIQNDLDFDEAQLSVFHTANDTWQPKQSYPLFDLGDGSMDMITIEFLVRKKEDKLLYTFDLFNNRVFKLELLGESELTRLAVYPRLVMAKSDPPDQLIDNDPVDNLPFAGDPSTVEDVDFDDEEDDEESEEEEEQLYEESEGQ